MFFRSRFICSYNMYSKIIFKSFNRFPFVSFILLVFFIIKIFRFMFDDTTLIIFLFFNLRIKNICIINILLSMIMILILLFFYFRIGEICDINNNLIIGATMFDFKSSGEKEIRVLHFGFNFLDNECVTLLI